MSLPSFSLPPFFWVSTAVPACGASFPPYSYIPSPLITVRTDIKIKRGRFKQLNQEHGER